MSLALAVACACACSCTYARALSLALVHGVVAQVVLDLRHLLAQQILEIVFSHLLLLGRCAGPAHRPLELLDLELELVALLACLAQLFHKQQ